jgi:hypothetical protein
MRKPLDTSFIDRAIKPHGARIIMFTDGLSESDKCTIEYAVSTYYSALPLVQQRHGASYAELAAAIRQVYSLEEPRNRAVVEALDRAHDNYELATQQSAPDSLNPN